MVDAQNDGFVLGNIFAAKMIYFFKINFKSERDEWSSDVVQFHNFGFD
jgi:hypothetical protein